MNNSYKERKERLKLAVEIPLNREFNNKGITYTLQEIEQQIVKISGIPSEELFQKTRKYPHVIFRMMAHYKAYFFCLNSLNDIANYLGKKHHCSILNSKKMVQNMLDTDKQFRAKYEYFLSN